MLWWFINITTLLPYLNILVLFVNYYQKALSIDEISKNKKVIGNINSNLMDTGWCANTLMLNSVSVWNSFAFSALPAPDWWLHTYKAEVQASDLLPLPSLVNLVGQEEAKCLLHLKLRVF